MVSLVVVRPAELVERKEIDVTRRLRGGDGLFVRRCGTGEAESPRLAALTRGHLEPRITQPEERLGTELRVRHRRDALEHARGVGPPLLGRVQRAECVRGGVDLLEVWIPIDELLIPRDCRRIIRCDRRPARRRRCGCRRARGVDARDRHSSRPLTLREYRIRLPYEQLAEL